MANEGNLWYTAGSTVTQGCTLVIFLFLHMWQVRTAFNVLGPMLNPAHAAYALVGVYDPAISPLMAAALQRLGITKALVVHSQGLDELTPLGDADIVEVSPR